MNTKKKTLPRVHEKETSNTSLIQWAIVAAVTLFLFIFPFKYALFNGAVLNFEAPLFEFLMYSSVIVFLLGIRFLYNWRLDDYRFLLSLGVLMLPLMYVLSSFQAASAHNAKLMVQLEFMTAAFFIVGLYMMENKIHRNIMEAAIQISGCTIVIYGFMNWFGQVYYPNALWLADISYRLTSVFQYSNSYAAFLTALFLGGLFSAIHTRQWYLRAIHSFMLVPIWLSLMLTYSRAALVLLPVIVLFILPFLKIGRQLLYLIYMVLAVLFSFLILSHVTRIGTDISAILEPASELGKTMSFWSPLPLNGWSFVLGISIVLAALIVFIHPRLSGFLEAKTAGLEKSRLSIAAVPALFIILGTLAVTLVLTSSGIRSLLPVSIANRLENINLQQHSVLERETFYRDSFKISADYPILGGGGGAWAALYQKYQNNPYGSQQTHSYLLQTMVEIGWLGLLVLLGFLITVYGLFIRSYIRNPGLRGGGGFYFFIISLSILAHSVIDFDMSFMFLSALVFLCLGAMLAPYHKTFLIPAWQAFQKVNWRWVFPSSISLLALVLFIGAYREYEARASFDHSLNMAVAERKPLNELLTYIDRAIAISPEHPDYTLLKIDWMKQAFNSTRDEQYRQEQGRLITQLKSYSPYDYMLLREEYQYYKSIGDNDRALRTIDEGLDRFPWDMYFYEAGMMEYYLSGMNGRQTDEQAANAKWDHSFALYQEVLDRIERLKSLPEGQLQGNEFIVTPTMRLALGQIYYNRHDYEQAINMLKEDINGNFEDPIIRSEVHAYLSALEAAGRKDEALQAKLVEAEEKAKAEALQSVQKATAPVEDEEKEFA
ncbi:O-antigen ligase family protein [Paenibacillus sepulcri]|uniref:O-antigen ligase family protein n=1 Tax=Paenibacillus sepulcri TaxID=359917 RepID=A0ABS7C3J7_9BACL|nr:O-antigen ligase family protein [Paenibacillus sepulcri]